MTIVFYFIGVANNLDEVMLADNMPLILKPPASSSSNATTPTPSHASGGEFRHSSPVVGLMGMPTPTPPPPTPTPPTRLAAYGDASPTLPFSLSANGEVKPSPPHCTNAAVLVPPFPSPSKNSSFSVHISPPPKKRKRKSSITQVCCHSSVISHFLLQFYC